MKALIHIILTGLLLPSFGLGFYYGFGGASGHPSLGMLFGGFIMLPVIALLVWPLLLGSVIGTAAICIVAARMSFRRLAYWLFGAAIVGAGYGVMLSIFLSLPRPWIAALAGSLSAIIGAYPLRDLWLSSDTCGAQATRAAKCSRV